MPATIATDRAGPSPSASVAGFPSVPLPTTASLNITNYTAAPSRGVVGHPVYFNVTVTGGSAPYTYWYTGLPHPCASESVASLYCLPGEVQFFNVTVFVNDSAGAHANATRPLQVWSGFTGPPHIVSFVAWPSSVDVYHLTTIYINATSSSVLGYTFLGLPPGCASFNISANQCIPSLPGVYHLRVLVADGFGIQSTSVTVLTVTGTVPPPPTSTGPAPPAPWVFPLSVGVVVIALAAGALVLMRRGKRARPPA
ncbi:MAG: hypothetical protein L3K23_08390 [Thermoplasmata archaeon]|nr:hypothetical protein [Thermoplasmata archaeon]